MEASQIISLIGALGIGSLIGILAKSFLDQRLSDKQMMFDARVRAYSGITGRVFNLFLEPDITVFREDALIFAKLNQLMSEAMLMASHTLAEMLSEFKDKVFEFHKALATKDESKGRELHQQLIELAGKIHSQMRKDLHVDRKSIYNA